MHLASKENSKDRYSTWLASYQILSISVNKCAHAPSSTNLIHVSYFISKWALWWAFFFTHSMDGWLMPAMRKKRCSRQLQRWMVNWCLRPLRNWIVNQILEPLRWSISNRVLKPLPEEMRLSVSKYEADPYYSINRQFMTRRS